MPEFLDGLRDVSSRFNACECLASIHVERVTLTKASDYQANGLTDY